MCILYCIKNYQPLIWDRSIFYAVPFKESKPTSWLPSPDGRLCLVLGLIGRSSYDYHITILSGRLKTKNQRLMYPWKKQLHLLEKVFNVRLPLPFVINSSIVWWTVVEEKDEYDNFLNSEGVSSRKRLNNTETKVSVSSLAYGVHSYFLSLCCNRKDSRALCL